MIKYVKSRIKAELQNIKSASALNIAAFVTNRETFGPLKNCNNGKSVVICGAGPTLSKYKPIPEAIHIALNRALLQKSIKYDWFFAEDWDGIRFFTEEIKSYDCLKFLGQHACGVSLVEIPESFAIEVNAKRFYTDSYMVSSGYDSRFICDIDKMAIGNMPNVALTVLPVALFTNPRRIYLVGCDASPGHFIIPENLSKKDQIRHERDLKMAVSAENKKIINKWKEFKEFANTYYPSTEIISVNPVGLKGLFKDVFQE